MPKHSGFKALKKLRKKKREVKPRAQKISVKRDGLESGQQTGTPDSGASLFNNDDSTGRRYGGMQKSRSFRRGSRNTKNRLLNALRGITASVFKKRSSANAAALEFAANHRRRSKREKRRHLVFVYGGIGVALAAVVLVVALLSPGGTAAPVDAVAANIQALDTEVSEQTSLQLTTLASKMPNIMPFSAALEIDEPDLTIPFDLDEFSGDDDPIVTDPEQEEPDPTESENEPEPEPTATSTPKPVKTTKPEPTAVPLKVDDFLDYFELKADTYYNDVNYSRNHYEYSKEEFLLLANIIDGEARGQSFKGQVAVGNVVMNRVLCSAWPNNIISVISARGQFSPYERVKDKTPSSSAKRAARAILDRELWVIPQDVYFFRSASRYKSLKGKDWGSHEYYGEVGGHFYYRHSYSGRKKGAGVPPALFDRTYKYAQYGCKPDKRVYRIQYMLNKLGYDVKADRYFGLSTKVALIEFQKKNKLTSDGVAGPATVKKLIQKFGVENYYERFIK